MYESTQRQQKKTKSQLWIWILILFSLVSFVSAQNNLIVLSDSPESQELAVANEISQSWKELNFDISQISEITKEDMQHKISIFLYKDMASIILNTWGTLDFSYPKDISLYLKNKNYLVNSISAVGLCPTPKVGESIGSEDCTLTPFIANRNKNSFSEDITKELFGTLKSVYPTYDSSQIFISHNKKWNPIILRDNEIGLSWNSIVSISSENYDPFLHGANVGYPKEDDSLFYIGKISLIQRINDTVLFADVTEKRISEKNINLPAISSTNYKISSNSQLGDEFYLELELYQYSVNSNKAIFSKKIASDNVGPFSIYAGPLTCKDYGSYVRSEDKIGGIAIEKYDKCISKKALLDAYCTEDNRTLFRSIDCLSCLDNTCKVEEETLIIQPSQDSNETEEYILEVNSDEAECQNIGLIHNGKYCSIDKQWIDQKKSDSSCENNFECSTNICIDSSCISSRLWQRFLEWIRNWL